MHVGPKAKLLNKYCMKMSVPYTCESLKFLSNVDFGVSSVVGFEYVKAGLEMLLQGGLGVLLPEALQNESLNGLAHS